MFGMRTGISSSPWAPTSHLFDCLCVNSRSVGESLLNQTLLKMRKGAGSMSLQRKHGHLMMSKIDVWYCKYQLLVKSISLPLSMQALTGVKRT